MSEVASVNGKTGAVVLAATDVEAVPASEAGQPNGVATLDSSSQLPDAQLPSSVVASSLKALGSVSGVVKLNLAEGTTFTATLTGATEFEVINAPAKPTEVNLIVTQDSTGGRAWSVKGLAWIGSEPAFATTKNLTNLVTILSLESATHLYATAGIEGPTGTAGNTLRSGEGTPAEGFGVSGDFYINTAAHTIYGPKAGTAWGTATSLVGPKGETGSTGATGAAGASSAGESDESAFGYVAPTWAGGNPLPTTTVAIGTSLLAIYNLIRLPKKGTLHGVYVWNGATVNGNHNVAVIDTGQSTAGEFTVLWESGSVAAAGESQWQLVGETTLGTEEVGRHLFLAVMNSGTTHLFGSRPEPVGGSPLLPTAFAVPRLIGKHTFGELKFAKLKESQLEASTKSILVVARIA